VTNISRSFYLQDGGKNRLKQNYVTVTLCIDGCCSWYCYKAVERLVQCRTVAFGSARVSLSQNMRTCLFVLRRAAASHLSTLHYKLSSQCPPRTHTQCTLANNLLCHGSTRLELPCCSMEIENWSMIWSIVCYVTIYFKSMHLTCSLFLTFYLCCCSSEPSCLYSPDLAPSYYFLIRNLKYRLCGTWFTNDESLMIAVDAASSCVYRDRCCDIQPWASAAHLYCSA